MDYYIIIYIGPYGMVMDYGLVWIYIMVWNGYGLWNQWKLIMDKLWEECGYRLMFHVKHI